MEELDNVDQILGNININRYEIDPAKNPRISIVDTIVLKDGPRVKKTAKHLTIVDEHTGEVHHHSIAIETHKKNKKFTSETVDDKHSIILEGLRVDTNPEEDELFRLLTFLQSFPYLPSAGKNLIIPTGSNEENLRNILQKVKDISISDKVDMISDILSYTKSDPDLLRKVAERLSKNPQAAKEVTATLNIARFSAALEDLNRLIESDAKEGKFQELLSKNEWMFGSEYSKLLDNRRWTRDELQDFMLRRTTDGYLELIEIKTPLAGKPLFLEDGSHASFYPRSELSLVLGQVVHYLEKLDAARYIIKSEDEEDVNKICAKIIIGRDGNKDQKNALRRLNGHLHRIEIITFDQLRKIVEQVLSYQQQIITPQNEEFIF